MLVGAVYVLQGYIYTHMYALVCILMYAHFPSFLCV